MISNAPWHPYILYDSKIIRKKIVLVTDCNKIYIDLERKRSNFVKGLTGFIFSCPLIGDTKQTQCAFVTAPSLFSYSHWFLHSSDCSISVQCVLNHWCNTPCPFVAFFEALIDYLTEMLNLYLTQVCRHPSRTCVCNSNRNRYW